MCVRPLLALGALLVGCSGPCWPAEGDPRALQLVEEIIQALGGPAFRSMRTRVQRGRLFSFESEELRGLANATIYTEFVDAPTQADPKVLYLRERQSFGKTREQWAVLFNEKGAWEITYRGARPLTEDVLERYRTSRKYDVFYILLRRLDEPGMLVQYKGRDIVDNQPAEVLEFIDAQNRAVTVAVHYSTKLPLQQSLTRRDQYGIPHVEVTTFGKYRDAGGGVQLPLVIQRYQDKQRVFALFAEEVTVNAPLKPELFELPPKIKLLENP